jgi:hypothetical protein
MNNQSQDAIDLFGDMFRNRRRKRRPSRERSRFELEVDYLPGHGCSHISQGRLRDLLLESKFYTSDRLPLGKADAVADGVERVRIIRNGDLYLELLNDAEVPR